MTSAATEYNQEGVLSGNTGVMTREGQNGAGVVGTYSMLLRVYSAHPGWLAVDRFARGACSTRTEDGNCMEATRAGTA